MARHFVVGNGAEADAECVLVEQRDPITPPAGSDARADTCLLSIVIATFNAQTLLRDCVASIVQQTFSDFEIILVDGASTDGTPALMQELAAAHGNLRWISEPDAGVYDAMNKGIRLARGRWLYFLGADDRLRDASVLESVARHLDGSVDLVYGNVVLENDPWGREGMIYGREFSVADITRGNICHQGIFYARRVFTTFGDYNPRYRVFADWELNLRLFNKVRKKYLPVNVATFHGGGMSARDDDPEFRRHFVEIITRELALDPASTLYREQARGLRRLWTHYALRGKFRPALKFFGLWLRHEKFLRRAG
jgi:glycosyltransferase involved in cell wall biosynthesis